MTKSLYFSNFHKNKQNIVTEISLKINLQRPNHNRKDGSDYETVDTLLNEEDFY